MTEKKITGQTLIEWGFEPGAWFKDAINHGNHLLVHHGYDTAVIQAALVSMAPKPVELDPLMQFRTNTIPFGFYLDVDAEEGSIEEDDQRENSRKVIEHMDALMRTPTIVAGAVLPDACPSGSQIGTIPVGGVVATRNAIHPGFHSADVCCSMNVSFFKRDESVSKVLDIAQTVTHFGQGHRSENEIRDHALYPALVQLVTKFEANPFLAGLERFAFGHFMTQGDGNHFLYVGHQQSTGDLALVTHHGSRALGGEFYKRGMAAAKRHTAIVSPRTPEYNSWIEADSEQGQHYWAALQLIRDWTSLNHQAIHQTMALRMGNKIIDRFWNEHNFVFQKPDGLFYHAKGSTPAYTGWSRDNDQDLTLIPLNMAEPILIAVPEKNRPADALGFAPHGAGRLLSRTTHMKRIGEEFSSDARGLSQRDQQIVFDRETADIDARFFTGKADLSELPSAYKSAASVRRSIEESKLIRVIDTILPGGAMMAGNTHVNWRGKKAEKKAKATTNG